MREEATYWGPEAHFSLPKGMPTGTSHLSLLGTSKESEGLDPALSHPIPGRLHVLVHQLPGRLPAQTLHSFSAVLSVTAHLGCQQPRVLERLVVDRPAGNGGATLGDGLLEQPWWDRQTSGQVVKPEGEGGAGRVGKGGTGWDNAGTF